MPKSLLSRSQGVNLLASAAIVGLWFVEAGTSEPTRSIAELQLESATGKQVAWRDLAGERATVVVFLSFDCPMTTGYSATLADLAKTYASRGVKFIGLCPGTDSSTVERQAGEHKLGFPSYADPRLVVADFLAATTTPEVFVLDGKNEVRYRGRIDDSYAKRLVRKRTVTEHYLADALDSLLEGKSINVPKTEAIGCKIFRESKPLVTEASSPTYYKDVLPLLQVHCQECHRPGNVAPFSLLSFKQAKTWATDIVEFTRDRRMPPWKAQAGREFAGDRRLPAAAIATFDRWLAAGCPEGNSKDAPPILTRTDGWVLGEPDLILEVPDEFVLGPNGRDLFRVFVMPTGLTEDRYIRAFDVRPSNSRIVHHAANFYDTTGSMRELLKRMQKEEKEKSKPADYDLGPGFTSGMVPQFLPSPKGLLTTRPPIGPLGAWAPGIMPRGFPPGTGLLLPKGADFVMQLHYHRNGRVERDRTKVGLYFSKPPVEKPVLDIVVPGRFKTTGKVGEGLGFIPAGEANFVARGTWYVQEDCTAYSVTPHMHLIGKSAKMTITPRGGKSELLIEIPHWDSNWQEQYFFKQPLSIKAGSRLEIEAAFDNSASNPNNPFNPPVDVVFGEGTTDEMLFGFLAATKDKPKSLFPFVISQGPFSFSR